MVWLQKTGTPVKAAKRVQFNMFLRKIDGFKLVENVSEGVFPLLWLEEVRSFLFVIQWHKRSI